MPVIAGNRAQEFDLGISGPRLRAAEDPLAHRMGEYLADYAHRRIPRDHYFVHSNSEILREECFRFDYPRHVTAVISAIHTIRRDIDRLGSQRIQHFV